MGFTSENGYTPMTFNTAMLNIMNGINEQFASVLVTPFTAETFVGTNFYKMFYALTQQINLNEVKTSEIFSVYKDYITLTNERISRPRVTAPGIIEGLEALGYLVSTKKPIDADAGKIFVAVDIADTDDGYAESKLEICTFIKDSTAIGTVSQGTEVEALVLSNGQSFDYKFNLADRIEPLLRLTITLSENNQFVIKTPDEIKAILLANIEAKYRIGKNFEPQRYFSILDAPWAESVLLEWSTDAGSNWFSTVVDMDYDEVYKIDLANVTLVEA